MREYTVQIRDKVFENVWAEDRYYATSQCARKYKEEHPEFTFVELMSMASAHLVKPKKTGRKSSYFVRGSI